ncbi:hypothetical protein TrRE_jg9988, partial [Triparma retinervis]
MKYIILLFAIIAISSLMAVDGWSLNPFKRGKKGAAARSKRDEVEDEISKGVSTTNEKLAVEMSEGPSTLKSYSYDYGAPTPEDEDGTLFDYADEEFNNSSFEDDSDFMSATYSYSFGTSKDPVAKSTAPSVTELSIVIETAANLLVGDSNLFAHYLDTPRGAHRLEENFAEAAKQLLRESKLPFAISSEKEDQEIGLQATLTSFTHTSDSQFEVQMSLHLTSRKEGGSVATKTLNQRAKLIELAVKSGQLVTFFDEEDGAFDTKDYGRGLRFVVEKASFLSAQKLKIEYNYDDWEKKVQATRMALPDSKPRRTDETMSFSFSTHGSYEGGDVISLGGYGSYDSFSYDSSTTHGSYEGGDVLSLGGYGSYDSFSYDSSTTHGSYEGGDVISSFGSYGSLSYDSYSWENQDREDELSPATSVIELSVELAGVTAPLSEQEQ